MKKNYVACIQGNFIVYIKTEDIYVDIAKDVETTFDTSNYDHYLKEKIKVI